MFTHIIARFVSLCLAWMTVFPAYASPVSTSMDVATLQAHYPHAQFLHVSAADYPALQQRLRQAGYHPQGSLDGIALAANERAIPAAEEAAGLPAERTDCQGRQAVEGQGGDDTTLRLVLDSIDSDWRGNNSGNGDAAAIVFVVIGAVVLIVWSLYVIKYLYDASFAERPCGGRWSDWAMSTSGMYQNSNQHALFSGLHYMTGVNDAGTNFGISAELGNSDILLTEVGSLRLQGMYWLIGPLLRWHFTENDTASVGSNPSYFQMEFVLGSTVHQDMGIMAEAKMGLHFGVGRHFGWGINFGALNINLHEQGIILDRTQFYSLWGLELGYRF